MSGDALGWAKRQDVGHAGAKGLLKDMADYANEDGFAWPSIARLAKEGEKSERHIKRLLAMLSERRFLLAFDVIDSRNGRTRPRLYWFPIRSDAPEPESLTAWESMTGGRVTWVSPSLEASNPEGEGDSHVTHEGDSGVTGRVTPESPLEPLPKLQRSIDLSQSARDDDASLFDAAWAAYPESGRRRTDEPAARAAWALAAGEVGRGERLVAAVLAYAADPMLKRGDHGAKGMHRWLSEKRWLAYLPEGDVAVAASGRPMTGRWAGPSEIREALVEAHGGGAAVSYLDTSSWDDAGRRIVTHTAYAADWLNREARALLKALNVTAESRTRSLP